MDPNRVLSAAMLVVMSLGGICCGMDAVAAGGSRAHEAGASVDASERATTVVDATANVAADATLGSAPDAGDGSTGPTCRPGGSACSKTSDCCGHLSCSEDDDELKTCQP